MKEATGELSTTVIAIVAIAAVLTLFTVVFLPTIRQNIKSKMYCESAICPDTCTVGEACKCTYYKLGDDNKETAIEVNCKISDVNAAS